MKNSTKSYFISGTKAFSQILKELNFEKNSEIIVPVTLCESIINVILLNNLVPVFCDINNNFIIDKIETKISKKTKMIVFVEQYGFLINDKKTYYNKNGEKIIKVLDACQSNLKLFNRYDYTFYSFNINKPIDIGNYSLVVTNHKINNSIQLPKYIKFKLFIKILLYYMNFATKLYKKYIIKHYLKIPGKFVEYKNKSLHRIIFIMDIDRNKYNIFDDLLYEYMDNSDLNVVQTTIEKAPYEKLNKKDKFNNFDELRYKTLYFRSNCKVKEYKKIINKINEVFYEKI